MPFQTPSSLSAAAGMMVSVPANTSPVRPLIGRAQEAEQLSGLLGLGHTGGGPGSVLLAGDAGVGKSRLLAELQTKFRENDWRVLVGHCLDFGDTAIPYLPFSEMFGRLTTESPALAESVAGAHPGVHRLMPGMRRLGDPDEVQARRVERGDLIEAVHAALEQLGRAAPLLVIVEDVHWADQSTREMLSFLFSRQFLQPVSFVASYRSDDLHRRHPLRGAVAEWSRLSGVTRIQLAPLGDPDVRTLIHSLHPHPFSESDLQAIVARAEGNAFFAEELVGAAELGGRALPDDLAELLLVRLDQLDEASSLAVRAISVAGRRVSHALLARVLDLADDVLDGALRAAVERNVLVRQGIDGYAFRHALLAEAVYDDLLPGERVRLHQAYSAALRAGDVESTAAEVARHARAGHDLPTAVQASIQAGAEAMAVGGPDEAAQHYQVALELVADERTGVRHDSVDIVDLTTRASEAVTAAGHPYRSVELVRDQLAQLPPDSPPADRAGLLVALASAALVSDTNVDPLATTTEALGLVLAEPPTPLRAKLLTLHARANAARHRDDDAARWGHEAVTLGRLLRLPAVVADATTTLSRLDDRSTDPDATKRALVHIIEQARVDVDLVGELRGLHNLGYTHYELGQLDKAQSVYDQAAARASSAGRPWAPYGLDARVLASITAYMRATGKPPRRSQTCPESRRPKWPRLL